MVETEIETETAMKRKRETTATSINRELAQRNVFYAELTMNAERISRLHLGLDEYDGVNFLWESHSAAHLSKFTGEEVTLWSAPTPSVLSSDVCSSSKVAKAECIIRTQENYSTSYAR